MAYRDQLAHAFDVDIEQRLSQLRWAEMATDQCREEISQRSALHRWRMAGEKRLNTLGQFKRRCNQ